jgi:hypothetical protein
MPDPISTESSRMKALIMDWWACFFGEIPELVKQMRFKDLSRCESCETGQYMNLAGVKALDIGDEQTGAES